MNTIFLQLRVLFSEVERKVPKNKGAPLEQSWRAYGRFLGNGPEETFRIWEITEVDSGAKPY